MKNVIMYVSCNCGSHFLFFVSFILAIQAQPPNDLEAQIKEIVHQKVYQIFCSINAIPFDPLSTHGAFTAENGHYHVTYACIAHCRVNNGTILSNLFHAGKSKLDPSGTKLNETQIKDGTNYPSVNICYDGFYMRMSKKTYEEIVMVNATVFRTNSIPTDISSQREHLYDFFMSPHPWEKVNLSNGEILNMKLKTIFKLDDETVPYIVLMQNKTGSYYRQASLSILRPIQISGEDKNDSSTIQDGEECKIICIALISISIVLFLISIILIPCIYKLCTNTSYKDKVQTCKSNCCRHRYHATQSQDAKNDDNL